jgi:hypothetical protein
LRRLKSLPLFFFAVAGATAFAGDLDRVGQLSQSEFHSLSQDLGAVAAYKEVAPAAPLGVAGFDVGLELTASKLQNKGVYEQAGGSATSTVYLPKLRVQKGLPWGVDIGAFVSKIGSSNISLMGLEARYALLDDTLAAPAIGLRVSGTRDMGAGKLDLSTVALDVVVSKKLTFITPFAGVGTVKVTSKTNAGGLASESFSQPRVFAGLNVNFVLVNLAVEAEKQGGVNSLSAKAGLRF